MDISNGEGIGVSLFVQGCHFHCKGCFNEDTWDFDGGKLWDDEVKETFMRLIDRPYITRVSILGGEPLCDENIDGVSELIYDIRAKFPDKKIWLYTGYKINSWFLSMEKKDFDDAWYNKRSYDRFLAVKMCDVVVDGAFELDKQDVLNEKTKWAGSTNQRIIRVYRNEYSTCFDITSFEDDQ